MSDNKPEFKASDFDPEVLGLFDQYVHGDLDRRGFLKMRLNLPVLAASRQRAY